MTFVLYAPARPRSAVMTMTSAFWGLVRGVNSGCKFRLPGWLVMRVSTCQALAAYERVAPRAWIALRTLAALTASRARVTCEIFLTLLMRSRISRADAMVIPARSDGRRRALWPARNGYYP